MKTTSLVLLGMVMVLVLLTSLAQPRSGSPSQELMREKLDHAQSVLEALTIENFELLGVHAKKLRALSEQPKWNLFGTAEYAEQSLLFKRKVDKLIKASGDRNLDAATLAWTEVTFSCVECHKYIRNRKVEQGSLRNPGTGSQSALFAQPDATLGAVCMGMEPLGARSLRSEWNGGTAAGRKMRSGNR